MKNGTLLTLDAGHYHPTETLTDKISACLCFVKEMLLHVSRGIRWDSDHVVILNDDLKAIAEELVRGDYLGRVRLGLDFFDASINRVAAWTIGTRATLKALLLALVEPIAKLREAELAGDYTSRLAMLEEPRPSPSAPSGITTASATTCRWDSAGSMKSNATRRTCSRNDETPFSRDRAPTEGGGAAAVQER